MKHRLIIALALALFFPSCQKHANHPGPSTRSFTDDVGHTVALQQAPRRIVSLAPSLTEILFLIGADSSVVGVTDYCDYPEAAKSKAKIGGMLNPNIERILALQPDLVLMSGSGNMRSDFEKLTSAGTPVYVSYPRSIDAVFKSIVDLGELTGRSRRADSVVAHLQMRRDSLVRQANTKKKETVLMILSLNPLVAIGPKTFLSELVTMANGQNIVRDSSTAYPVLSREEILRRQPGVIIATNDIVRSIDDILAPYPEWKSLSAIRNKRVAIVDASIVSRPGPRIIDGLEAIIRAIHGER
ncbi:MAG: cobalamin-binding protein [Ignavibacteriales bacterium]|nr:cobalamin-binding protein [Ignavibacteriales bacterium]